jgi:hypothetical protein
MVRKRTRPEYTLDQADALTPADWNQLEDEAVRALLDQRAKHDDGEGGAEGKPPARTRRAASSS